MKIAIRVDASVRIGTGHFMRCLTLADALQQQGANIRFISRELPEHLRQTLQVREHQFALLSSTHSGNTSEELLPHSHWLDATQAQDAADTLQALAGEAWEWLIVDHYALDFRWESTLRQITNNILVIDDLADRRHDCNILLDQNYYQDMEARYHGKVPEQCRLLCGPRYALVRDEFRQLHDQVRPLTQSVKRILVFFGGIDAANYTGLAIEALGNIGMTNIHVDVVIGAQHPFCRQIETVCAQHQFTCHVQTEKMADLMAAADLSIGAGGSATWERCCLGLPTLAFSTADNQLQQLADAARAGLLYAPEMTANISATMQIHAKALIENCFLREHISTNSLQAVDGRGAIRIIRKLGYAIVEHKPGAMIDVRLANPEDALLVWPWRNAEATRRHIFDPSPVSLDTHLHWWHQSLHNRQRVLLIGRLDGKEAGVIRYDFVNSHQANISIYLNPEQTGCGLGLGLLRKSQDWLLQNYPEIDTIVAEVMPKNIASLQAFLSAGFQEQYTILSWKKY